ncbi:MAG: hypothetical protein ACP5KN_17475, partial [Armatimonadota bacterium]
MRRWSALVALVAATMCLQPAAAEPVKVPNVPDVGWSQGRDFHPIACLHAALVGMDKNVSYQELMVASGAAFRVAWRSGAYDAGAKIFYGYDAIVEAAPAAGVRAELVTAPDEDGAWEIITESIDRGAPLISRAGDSLQIICGYDPDTRDLLCRTWDVEADEYVQLPLSSARLGADEAAAGAYELWVLHEEGEPPDELDWPNVLGRALQMSRRSADDPLHGRYICGLAAYEAWAETLRDPSAHDGLPDAGAETVTTALSFAEARDAAAQVLQEHGHVHDAFARAAQAYRSEAAELRGLQWLLCRDRQASRAERMAMSNESVRDAAIREEAAHLVEGALAYERVALQALTAAFEDLAPAEMVAELAETVPERAVPEEAWAPVAVVEEVVEAEPVAPAEEAEEVAPEAEEARPAAEETVTEAAPTEEREAAAPYEAKEPEADEQPEAAQEPETAQEEQAEPEGPTADELVAEGLAAKRAGRLDAAAES